MELIVQPFDPVPLYWFATYQRRRTQQMIELVARRLPVASATGSDALRKLYNLDHPDHFLRARPSLMARQHEPQVTRSFRNALANPNVRLGRVQAMFDAVLGDESPKLAQAAMPIADDDADRLDLFLAGTTVEGAACGLVLEAKFGHSLQAHQLREYRRRALRRLDSNQTPQLFLAVVAGSLRPADKRLIDADRRAGRSPHWRQLTWHQLLIRLQAALPADLYDQPLRDFLRLVWDRSNDC